MHTTITAAVSTAVSNHTINDTLSITTQIPNAKITHHVETIFLETPAAQGIAGAFVWTALLITCHQVLHLNLFTFYF